MGNLKREDLREIETLQGFDISGIANVIHVAEHLSYHTGQIAFWTKCLKNKGLWFYSGIDLNIRNT